MLPNIVEKIGRNTEIIDIPTKLFEKDIITLFGEIDEIVSYEIISQLLYLDTLDKDENIKLYINSNGGSVVDGLAIIDTMQFMNRKVNTIIVGQAASMGTMIALSGTGTRKSLKNSRIMLHSVSGGNFGNYHDLKISLQEIEYLQNKLMKMISEATKQDLKVIENLLSRDKWFSAQEAKEFKLIDEIIS